MFTRVYQGGLYVHHRIGRVRWGLAYEAVLLEDRARLHALTPEVAIGYRGVELALRDRLAWLRDERDPNAPGDPFNLSLDWLF
jgi:hypothetical protein